MLLLHSVLANNLCVCGVCVCVCGVCVLIIDKFVQTFFILLHKNTRLNFYALLIR